MEIETDGTCCAMYVACGATEKNVDRSTSRQRRGKIAGPRPRKSHPETGLPQRQRSSRCAFPLDLHLSPATTLGRSDQEQARFHRLALSSSVRSRWVKGVKRARG